MLENLLGQQYVPSSFDSSAGNVSIITGPNMGGFKKKNENIVTNLLLLLLLLYSIF